MYYPLSELVNKLLSKNITNRPIKKRKKWAPIVKLSKRKSISSINRIAQLEIKTKIAYIIAISKIKITIESMF